MGYRIVLLVKLAAVMAYGGGLVGAFLASSLEERRRAVHAIASPALLVIWMTGYVLTSMVDIPLTELWILGALVASLASQLALVHSVSHDRRTPLAFLVAAAPLVVVLALMVFRPTWSLLRSP